MAVRLRSNDPIDLSKHFGAIHAGAGITEVPEIKDIILKDNYEVVVDLKPDIGEQPDVRRQFVGRREADNYTFFTVLEGREGATRRRATLQDFIQALPQMKQYLVNLSREVGMITHADEFAPADKLKESGHKIELYENQIESLNAVIEVAEKEIDLSGQVSVAEAHKMPEGVTVKESGVITVNLSGKGKGEFHVSLKKAGKDDIVHVTAWAGRPEDHNVGMRMAKPEEREDVAKAMEEEVRRLTDRGGPGTRFKTTILRDAVDILRGVEPRTEDKAAERNLLSQNYYPKKGSFSFVVGTRLNDKSNQVIYNFQVKREEPEKEAKITDDTKVHMLESEGFSILDRNLLRDPKVTEMETIVDRMREVVARELRDLRFIGSDEKISDVSRTGDNKWSIPVYKVGMSRDVVNEVIIEQEEGAMRIRLAKKEEGKTTERVLLPQDRLSSEARRGEKYHIATEPEILDMIEEAQGIVKEKRKEDDVSLAEKRFEIWPTREELGFYNDNARFQADLEQMRTDAGISKDVSDPGTLAQVRALALEVPVREINLGFRLATPEDEWFRFMSHEPYVPYGQTSPWEKRLIMSRIIGRLREATRGVEPGMHLKEVVLKANTSESIMLTEMAQMAIKAAARDTLAEREQKGDTSVRNHLTISYYPGPLADLVRNVFRRERFESLLSHEEIMTMFPDYHGDKFWSVPMGTLGD